jgi:hypothetical protein
MRIPPCRDEEPVRGDSACGSGGGLHFVTGGKWDYMGFKTGEIAHRFTKLFQSGVVQGSYLRFFAVFWP